MILTQSGVTGQQQSPTPRPGPTHCTLEGNPLTYTPAQGNRRLARPTPRPRPPTTPSWEKPLTRASICQYGSSCSFIPNRAVDMSNLLNRTVHPLWTWTLEVGFWGRWECSVHELVKVKVWILVIVLLTWVIESDSWPAVLYNLGSGSWLAWANGAAAHYVAIHCPC